jgi:phytoene synthase
LIRTEPTMTGKGPAPVEPSLAASREACRTMTAFHAKTFYFASHTLPSQKRGDAYAVYAFCRYVDDRIDLAPDEAARVAGVADLRALLDAAYAPGGEGTGAAFPWLPAFRETVRRRTIPRAYFDDLIAGVELDRGRVRIETWEELERYCYLVAGVVGLIMVHVLAEPVPELLAPARDLGTAMQLTNILRDIDEDWRRDRIYLPRRDLEKFGLNEEDIAQRRLSDPFRTLLRFEIGRARSYYNQAEPGIRLLPRDGSQRTVRLMSTIYGAILDEIERADYQVFGARRRVSLPRKLWLAARVWCG